MKRFALMTVLAGLMAATTIGAAPAFAGKTKFEFRYGLSGDLGERVQDACRKFNETQADLKIACTIGTCSITKT